MNENNTSMISTIRNGGVWVRSLSAVVILAFGGLVTSPAVAATRAEMERQERTALPEQTESARLNTALVSVKNELRKLAGKPDVLDRVASKEERKAAREALKDLRKQLRELDKAARADFREIEKHLKANKLSDVILQRHHDAVAKYEAEAEALLTDLAGIEALGDAKAAERAAKAFERLDKKQLRRSHQPFDPNQLPNRSLKADDKREPRLEAEQFIADMNAFDANLALAANENFDLSGLQDANNAAYLAPTTEAVLSEAIQAKAAELNHDPVAIYNWVRNNVQWQPTWGAVQNADITLSAERGNAFDIASLTIALLRASGIPARYVHGTIEVPEDRFRNWIGGFEHIEAATDFAAAGGIPVASVTAGGKVTKVRLEHVWVEAALDFHPSRGAVNRAADQWVSMDPSFKQYEFLEGLDPVAISGLDPEALATDFLNSGTVNEEEGWVTGFDPAVLQSAQDQTQQALTDYINENLPEATVGDVLGGRRIIEQAMPILAGTLDNRIVAAGMRYAELPDAHRQHIVFGFGVDLQGYPLQSQRFKWTALNNERVTLSFSPATQADEDALASLLPEGEITDISQLPTSIPAYLINVVPELKVNDDVVMEGSAMKLGEELTFTFTPEFAGRYAIPQKYNVIAGSYLAVAVVAGNVSPQALNDSKTRLEATKAILETQNPDQLGDLTREDLLGDLFHAGLLGYYGQYTAMSYIAGLKQGGHHYLAGGLGSYGYEPEVEYYFGTPREIFGGGAAMNIPIVNIYGFDGDGTAAAKQSKLNYVLQLGTLSSALEHAVPEQMFVTEESPGEAISAVKALSKASAAGQRIYQINAQNQSAALPLINHDSATMNEIRNALATGKEVITHTDAVSVPGWSGAGYIIYDPVTGDGAYKIGGGSNGASLIIIGFFAILIIGIASIALGPIGIAFGLYTVYSLATGFAAKIEEITSSGNFTEKEMDELSGVVFTLVLNAIISSFLASKVLSLSGSGSLAGKIEEGVARIWNMLGNAYLALLAVTFGARS